LTNQAVKFDSNEEKATIYVQIRHSREGVNGLLPIQGLSAEKENIER